jgi:hypothetical protein
MPNRVHRTSSVAGDAPVVRNAIPPGTCLCGGLLLVASVPNKGLANAPASNWTGTSAIAQMPDNSGKTFTNQTLRQIVRVSVSGKRVRLMISNLFSTQPLRVEDVHLALRRSGSSIIASSDRQLRLKGARDLSSLLVRPRSAMQFLSMFQRCRNLRSACIFPARQAPRPSMDHTSDQLCPSRRRQRRAADEERRDIEERLLPRQSGCGGTFAPRKRRRLGSLDHRRV